MIVFELDETKEGIEILLDDQGINELINYLIYIKNSKDHFHLVVGNELSEELITQNHGIIKHVVMRNLEP